MCPIDIIVAKRKELGISQLELAILAGVDQPSLSKIERHIHKPTLKTLEALAAALGFELGFELLPVRRP